MTVASPATGLLEALLGESVALSSFNSRTSSSCDAKDRVLGNAEVICGDGSASDGIVLNLADFQRP